MIGKFLTALGIVLLSACSQPTNQPSVYEEQLYVFGTLIDISIQGETEEKAHQAVAAIEQQFNAMHQQWHAWQPGRLADINQALADSKSITLIESEKKFIQQASRLSINSDHLFNPAIGHLIGLWGFLNDERNKQPPTQSSIKELVALQPTMADLNFSGLQLSSNNPHVKLDFGGIAKGYAVDLAINKLKSFDIHNAIVNTGGDLRAIGRKGQQPWRIGIRHPRQTVPLAYIETQGDEAIFTSGDYERYFTYQEQRYHHIIDPRTGYPATGATSVTVICDNGLLADATATALLIAGPEKWQTTALAMGVDQVMLIDQQGTVYMTSKMAARVQFIDKTIRQVVF